jgi:hypothetical protein
LRSIPPDIGTYSLILNPAVYSWAGRGETVAQLAENTRGFATVFASRPQSQERSGASCHGPPVRQIKRHVIVVEKPPRRGVEWRTRWFGGLLRSLAAPAFQNLVSLGHRAAEVVLDGLFFRHRHVVPGQAERRQFDVAGVVNEDQAEAAGGTRDPRTVVDPVAPLPVNAAPRLDVVH